jgi:hypothetical protein
VGPGQRALFSIFGRQRKIAVGATHRSTSTPRGHYNNCLALAPYRLAALILFR